MAVMPNLIPALPELFLTLSILALLMFGVFQKTDSDAGQQQTLNMVSWLSVLTLGMTMLLMVAFSDQRAITFSGMFINDSFAVFSKILVLLGSGFAIIISQDFISKERMTRFEYPVLILLASLGMMLMLSANGLISLYLGLEMQSLSLYILAAFQRDDQRSTEAGLKYFILGAVASGLLLYGSSLVYGFAGSTDFTVLAEIFADTSGESPSTGLIFGIVFILAGLAFKVSAVPFHMWTPDVYEGAPTPVTAFFAVAPKIAALGLFIRVMVGPFAGMIEQWQQIIVLISIASMVLGAFAAINQQNIKRMMAYSSIGHAGYALIGLAVGTSEGIRGVLVYLAIYLFMTVGAFACILCMRRSDRMVEKIDDLAGLSKTHPLIALCLTIFMFSMAGIPPLAGFFGKLYIFLSAVEAELYGLAVIGVLASVVGAYYYLRIIRIMYFDDATDPLDKNVPRSLTTVTALMAAIIVLFFLSPQPIIDNAAIAAASLFPG